MQSSKQFKYLFYNLVYTINLPRQIKCDNSLFLFKKDLINSKNIANYYFTEVQLSKSKLKQRNWVLHVLSWVFTRYSVVLLKRWNLLGCPGVRLLCPPKCPTLDFGSGLNLRVLWSQLLGSSQVSSSMLSGESAPPCHPHSRLMLSLSQINKIFF